MSVTAEAQESQILKNREKAKIELLKHQINQLNIKLADSISLQRKYEEQAKKSQTLQAENEHLKIDLQRATVNNCLYIIINLCRKDGHMQRRKDMCWLVS